MKTWFWPQRIKDELSLTKMGTVEGGVALKRKMPFWDMLNLRCLLDSQYLELSGLDI